MRAAEAVDLARRTGRCLLVRIIKARGAPVSNDDDLWGSGEEARRVVEGSVALVLDEDGEDAGFLRAAYTEIVDAPALVLISGETGEQLLLLQRRVAGEAEGGRGPAAARLRDLLRPAEGEPADQSATAVGMRRGEVVAELHGGPVRQVAHQRHDRVDKARACLWEVKPA